MKDKYKHLLNFTANIISLAVEAAMFGWVWYMLYIPMLDKANTFFNRGNWAVIGMYVLFVFFFTKIFGGYRIGYMRISDIILSQILAVILAMIVAYFEICLVANDYLPPQPLPCWQPPHRRHWAALRLSASSTCAHAHVR